MSWFDFLRGRRRLTASVAKERLQIILSHERANRNAPDFLPALQQDIIRAVTKYVTIAPDDVKVHFERRESSAVLELNIALPADAVRRREDGAKGPPPKVGGKHNKAGGKRHSG